MGRRRSLLTFVGGAGVFVFLLCGTADAQQPALVLSPEEAVALALEHDLELQRARLGPRIADLDVTTATTAWTPEMSANISGVRRQSPPTTAIDPESLVTDRQVTSELAVSQRLSWGSSYRVAWDAGRIATNSALSRYQPHLRSSLGVTFEQPLLRNVRIDAARADRDISLRTRHLADVEFAAAVAATRREVLHAYWTWVFARDLLGVQHESLRLAQELLEGNRERVATGAMAAVDVIEAEVEVARRTETILVAETAVRNAEERLRLHIFEPGDSATAVALEPEPRSSEAPPVLTGAAEQALTRRHDLKALETALAIDAIEVRRFRNERLPEASLRAHYAVQGTGGTELLRSGGFPGPIVGSTTRDFASVLDDLFDSKYPSWTIELAVSYPLGMARAEANLARASLQRQQRETALRAAEQRVEVEVGNSVRTVDANYRRLDTSARVVDLSERRLDGEERKFAAGLSSSFFVFEAQRDLSLAREAQLKALFDYRVSVVDLEAVQEISLDTPPGSVPPQR